ncbi:unnamed protein product [Phytomonas sp. EM1]|nr:unnamed protein product [Phytomonas sp. EM1]|eukprot:CCW60200.1 unnamed protein product [Phytomonas sp. isolate EM1]
MLLPWIFYVVVAYSKTNPKALSATHPSARLAMELTETEDTEDLFHLKISSVNKNQFGEWLTHDDGYPSTNASDSCSNTSSLRSYTSSTMRRVRVATCTHVAAIDSLKSAKWWCLRPILYEGCLHVLPLAVTLKSIPLSKDSIKGLISSDASNEAPPFSLFKLERCKIEWLSIADTSTLHQVVLDNCPGISRDLSELLPFTRLMAVSLHGLDQLHSLDGLSSCTKLEILCVHSCLQLRDLAVIKKLPKLLELDIKDLAITSLVPGEDSTPIPSSDTDEVHGQLEVVRLTNCPNLVDLSFLKHHHRISNIFMAHLPITNIDWLRCHDELKQVVLQSLQGLRLSSADQVRELCLPYLRHLIIEVPHPESNLDMLRQCLDLEELQLRWWNHEVDWFCIQYLGFLKVLRLSHNDSLTELGWIRHCTYLKVLNVSFNRTIQDFSPISSLCCLEKLNLSVTKVTDEHIASIAAACTKLNRVILDNCSLLRDLSPLGQLLDLRVFSATNTRINSIKWIVNCVHLTKVTLRQCGDLNDTSPLDCLPMLRTRDL